MVYIYVYILFLDILGIHSCIYIFIYIYKYYGNKNSLSELLFYNENKKVYVCMSVLVISRIFVNWF